MAPAVSPHLSLVGRDFENGGVSLRRFVTLSLTILLKATFRCQFDPKYSHPPVLFTTPQIRRESKPSPSFSPWHSPSKDGSPIAHGPLDGLRQRRKQLQLHLLK